MKSRKQWKKSSIVIGSPTNILAALTSFIPVIWLCTTYDCWPPISTVPYCMGHGCCFLWSKFYFVEPVSYYAALGMTGTYLSFLSGNIGNIGVPCAALALDVTHSTKVQSRQRWFPPWQSAGSIITNLIRHHFCSYCRRSGFICASHEFMSGRSYEICRSAIFGATFGNFAFKYPKVRQFAA